MKVEQKEKTFAPVVITIASLDELQELVKTLNKEKVVTTFGTSSTTSLQRSSHDHQP